MALGRRIGKAALLAVVLASITHCDGVESALPVLAPARHAIDSAQRSAPSPSPSVIVDAPRYKPSASGSASAEVPAGYVMMTPVARSGEYGHAVLLMHPDEDLVVPIYIGGTEALSIELRLQGEKFTRPLTHDLLDDLVTRMGGKMLRAQVDALTEGVFMGSVVFETSGTFMSVDSRPSDAIALALGNRVPIYVALDVVLEAGIRPRDISASKPHPKTPPVAL